MRELQAMAMLEAMHSGQLLQDCLFKVCGGAICKVDTLLRLTSQQEWWEEYCLNFALDAGAAH